MNKIPPILSCAGALLTVLLFSCSSASNTAQVAKPNSEEQAIAERVFKLVNIERVKAGKKEVRGSMDLNGMAQGHSKFQATSGLTQGKPSDFGSTNRAQYAYLKYGITNLGEVYSGVPVTSPDPAKAAVAAWVKRVEHNRYLKQTWDLTGVGVYKANRKYYITMMVGVRASGVPRSMEPGSGGQH